MELMQLEMFVAVVEGGSIRAGAERVYRTQPAVSMAMHKLEEEFDGSLFDRSRRYEFRLTQAGETLYRYAKRMLSLRKEAGSELSDILKLRVGRLRLGANESISLHLLPRLAQRFLQQYPGMQMEVKCERSEGLLTDLKARELDLALVSFRPDDPELESSFVTLDELVLISSPKHALAEKGHVQFKDLSQESVLMMDVSQSSPWHKRVADAFLQSKVPFHFQVENAPIEAIKRMVAIGLGVGFVPLMCVREEMARGELAVVAVEGFHQERRVWLVRRWAMLSHSVAAFTQVAVAFGEEIQERDRAESRKPMTSTVSGLAKHGKLEMVKRGA
jgi:DNA-binding transcriptional LysR family regulator